MIFTLAFASNDGENVNEHFGSARRFYIAKLDTEKEDCDISGEYREVTPSCKGGFHETDAFAAILSALDDVDVIIAQRAGPGAKKYIQEQNKKIYEIPLSIEQAVCLLLEEREWEVGKWLSHTKN